MIGYRRCRGKFLVMALLMIMSSACAYSNENDEETADGGDKCPSIVYGTYPQYLRSLANCRSTPNCEVIYPGECYCPPGVQCICGGGPPPKCVEKVNKESKQDNEPLPENPVSPIRGPGKDGTGEKKGMDAEGKGVD